MATVYVARDERHNRNVALKVLKPELAAVVGADRFLAEIETTANLQHPHILPLFDSGEADGFLFYVMPYVEGESLRARLDREHQLPVDEAVQIAKDVAEALQAAHDQGVIHRDVKPANILLSKGRPLVSDFGIALALGAAGAGRLTETGLSLGTPHYMSPEQATGDLSVGAATDIYALGCVLYEMLVGEPPYTGSTGQAILGKIIQAEPVSATKARRSVPTNVDAAIRRALEKLPADRFASARAFADALADTTFRYGDSAGSVGGDGSWNRLTVTMTAVAIATTVVAIWALLRPSASAAPGRIVSTIPPPPGHQFLDRASLALSPNGRRIAFAALSDEGTQQLWLRDLDAFEARMLPDTNDGHWPFWSPDGQALGFFADGQLWTVQMSEDSPLPTELCAAPSPGGGTWSGSGVIVFSSGGDLWRVASTGGNCEPLYADSSTVEFFLPDFLPNDNQFVVSRFGGSDSFLAAVMVGSLDGDPMTTVTLDGRNPRFVPPEQLLYESTPGRSPGTQIVTATFDLRTLGVTSEPRTVVPLVLQSSGIASYSVSKNGTLAYLTGHLNRPPVELDRDGRPLQGFREEPLGTWSFDVAREHRWLFQANETRGLFLYDWGEQRAAEPLSTLGVLPVAGPGDTLVAYLDWSVERPGCAVSVVNVGSGQVDTLLTSRPCLFPTDWSPNGNELLLSDGILWLDPGIQTPSIWTYSFSDGQLRPSVQEQGVTARFGQYSPDGRWIAYTSDRVGGRFEVYVQPRDGSSRPVPVSRSGGAWPRWRSDGAELYFVSPDGGVYAVEIPLGDPPSLLFTLRGWDGLAFGDQIGTLFDVAPDGTRFFVRREALEPRRLTIIQSWGSPS